MLLDVMLLHGEWFAQVEGSRELLDELHDPMRSSRVQPSLAVGIWLCHFLGIGGVDGLVTGIGVDDVDEG